MVGGDTDELNVAVVYTYPITGERVHVDFARRFVSTYLDEPAGAPHTLYVVCNGGAPRPEDLDLWSAVECTFIQHDDTGWDIGAFQRAAGAVDCDMMVCCGGHTYWVRPQWLRRMTEVFREYGPGLYGASGSLERDPHIRTTTFWCHPGLLQAYPKKVETWAERYAFEASPESLTRLALEHDLPCLVITWDDVYDLSESRRIPDTFRIGDQSNTLASDRYFDVWATSSRKEQRKLARLADGVPPGGIIARAKSRLSRR